MGYGNNIESTFSIQASITFAVFALTLSSFISANLNGEMQKFSSGI